MDEIVNLPLEMQSKLLRVLQENEIRPVGSNKTRSVNVRIITAASASLIDMVKKGDFREDLFYRLYVYPIPVPSLQERKDDIPLLANYFLKKFADQQNKKAEVFHSSLNNFLKKHKWPGNIRELENAVERLITVANANSKVINQHVLPSEFKREYKKINVETIDYTVKQSLQENMEAYEAGLIRQALEETNWNQRKAARLLKISERNLRYKMVKLGIEKT